MYRVLFLVRAEGKGIGVCQQLTFWRPKVFYLPNEGDTYRLRFDEWSWGYIDRVSSAGSDDENVTIVQATVEYNIWRHLSRRGWEQVPS